MTKYKKEIIAFFKIIIKGLAFLLKVRLLSLQPFKSQYYLQVPIQNLLCAQHQMTVCRDRLLQAIQQIDFLKRNAACI